MFIIFNRAEEITKITVIIRGILPEFYENMHHDLCSTRPQCMLQVRGKNLKSLSATVSVFSMLIHTKICQYMSVIRQLGHGIILIPSVLLENCGGHRRPSFNGSATTVRCRCEAPGMTEVVHELVYNH